LLGDSGATFKAAAGKGIKGGAGDAQKIETKVAVKIFIFDTDGGLFDVVGQVGDFDRISILFAINFVEEFTVAVKNLGTDGAGTFGQTGGVRDIFEEKEGVENQKDKAESDEADNGLFLKGSCPGGFLKSPVDSFKFYFSCFIGHIWLYFTLVLMTKNLRRLLIYYLYLLVSWGAFRYFVRLPEVVTELWFKPMIWLVPLYWWRLSLKGEPRLFAGKIRPALGWGLLGGLMYFGALRLLTNSGFSFDVNRIGIAGVTAVVEELTFAGVMLSILVKETKREGVSLALTGLAFAAIHLPRQIFVFSLAPSLVVGAFSLAFFVGLINGFLRLRSNNVLAAMVAHFVFLLLALA